MAEGIRIGGGGREKLTEIVTTGYDMGNFSRGCATCNEPTKLSFDISSELVNSNCDYNTLGEMKYVRPDTIVRVNWEVRYETSYSNGFRALICRVYRDNGDSITLIKATEIFREYSMTNANSNLNFIVDDDCLVIVDTSYYTSSKYYPYIIKGTIDLTTGNVTDVITLKGSTGKSYEYKIKIWRIKKGVYVAGIGQTKSSYGRDLNTLIHIVITDTSITMNQLDVTYSYENGPVAFSYEGGLMFFGVSITSNVGDSGTTFKAMYITEDGTKYTHSYGVGGKFRPILTFAISVGGGKFIVPTGDYTLVYTFDISTKEWAFESVVSGDAYPGITDIGATSTNDIGSTICVLTCVGELGGMVKAWEDIVYNILTKELGIIVEEEGAIAVLTLGRVTNDTISLLLGKNLPQYIGQYESYLCNINNLNFKFLNRGETVNIYKLDEFMTLKGSPNGVIHYKKSGDKATWLI